MGIQVDRGGTMSHKFVFYIAIHTDDIYWLPYTDLIVHNLAMEEYAPCITRAFEIDFEDCYQVCRLIAKELGNDETIKHIRKIFRRIRFIEIEGI